VLSTGENQTKPRYTEAEENQNQNAIQYLPNVCTLCRRKVKPPNENMRDDQQTQWSNCLSTSSPEGTEPVSKTEKLQELNNPKLFKQFST
jgi:hypothetical protein